MRRAEGRDKYQTDRGREKKSGRVKKLGVKDMRLNAFFLSVAFVEKCPAKISKFKMIYEWVKANDKHLNVANCDLLNHLKKVAFGVVSKIFII